MSSIAFRLDANETIGMGHLTRCITLAQQLAKLSFQIWFIGHFNALGKEIIRASGFEPGRIIKKIDQLDLSEDAQNKDAINVLATLPSDAVFLVKDSYSLGCDWDKHIADEIALLTFDDGAPSQQAAKVIVNPRLDVSSTRYQELNPLSTILTGAQFALIPGYLRENQFNEQFQIDKRKIAVCLGGGVHRSIFNEIATSFTNYLQQKNCRIQLVTKFDLQHSAKNTSITTIEPQPRIWEKIADARIIICAGGNMLYESCFLGKSLIGIALNQIQAQHLKAVSRTINFPIINLEQLDKLPTLTDELLFSGATEKLISRRGKVLIDGHGAERIAEIVEQMCN